MLRPAAGAVPRPYALFWIFLSAAVLGAAAETAFMLLTRGQLQNRSGLLYGQLSLVWGLGAVLLTLLLCRLSLRSCPAVFFTGALAGTGWEYLCSWFQQAAFGLSFWDYRHLPLNLNGRVNLLFSLVWGGAAVVWARVLLPPLRRRLDPPPGRRRRVLTAVLALLLAADTALTCAALQRMDQRRRGLPAATPMERFLDRTYPDSLLELRFSTLTHIGAPPPPDG